MRKIGSTTTGSVIIEMTAAQFAALTQVITADPKPEVKKPAQLPVMALKRKQTNVRNCLEQLRPENRQEVIRSIRAMYRGMGGIREEEIIQIMESLVKEGYLSFDADERACYADEGKPVSILQKQNGRKEKGDTYAQKESVATADQASLEKTFTPSLLVEVPEGDQPVDGDAEVK